MARTTQITIASVSLTPGLKLPVVSPRLPADATLFSITTTPSVWPASGDVLDLLCEVSFDDGVTFPFVAKLSLASVGGTLGVDKQGATILSSVWNTTLPFAGNALRRANGPARVAG